MDVLRGSGVTAAMREAAERGAAPTSAADSPRNAATAPLNPLAPEFVVGAPAPPNAAGSPRNNATAPLNPLAPEFVVAAPAPTEANSPGNNATTTPLNPLAPEFVVATPAPTEANPLNPDAMEFLPWWRPGGGRELSADAPEYAMTAGTFLVYALPMVMGFPICPYYYNYNNYNYGNGSFQAQQQSWPTPQGSSTTRRRTVNYSQQGRFRSSYRVRRTQTENFVRKTIYVTNIDNTVTEEMLAQLFGSCGTVVDCRICGDPTSRLRFAFIEFQYWEDACAAQHLDGFTVGQFPLKIMPSRTAIMPINPSFLPQSEEEKEMCSRTIYCSNIEKTVTETELKGFCEEYFGSVSRISLIGGDDHITGVAFVEFIEYSAAAAALNSTGLNVRGNLIRVSPSKTPIRITNDKHRRRREICSSSSARL